MRTCSYASAGSALVITVIAVFGACAGSQAPGPNAAPSEPGAAPGASASPTPAEATASGPAASAASDHPAAATTSSAPVSSAGPDRNLDDIRAVIAGNRDAFRGCYDRIQKGHPGTQGDFVLHFVVNPDGTLKSGEADQQKSEIHVPEMATCAVGVLKTLKFPPSRKGMETTVNYPFNFKPGSTSGSSPSHP